jgi:hypothetical protein
VETPLQNPLGSYFRAGTTFLPGPSSYPYSPKCLEGWSSRKLGLISHITLVMLATKLALGMPRERR